MDFSNLSRKEKLELLNKAKDAYYNSGEEILNDTEYDELEADLGLENKNYVGSKHGSYTVKHSFIMGSLAKIQIKEDKKTGVVDWDGYAEEFEKYFNKASGCKYFETTPKLDGASFSAEFKVRNGKAKLISCATRGDGQYGSDIKHWFEPMLKTQYWSKIDDACNDLLENNDILCIRGEVLVPHNEFAEKYSSDFTNPRSFVSGRLGLKSSEIEDKTITGSDLHFVCYDYRIVDGDDGTFTELSWMNPYDGTYKLLSPYLNHIGELPEKKYCQVHPYNGNFTGEELQQIYEEYAEFRSTSSQYALDGIVFKPEASARQYNDNRARPVDCVAMKFIPIINATEIIDIEWNVKKTGEYFPKAIIKPIYLDGKKIEKASLHNYNYIITKNCGIGSSVKISLAGDIIPYVYEIVYAAGTDNINLPENCEVYTEPKSGIMHLMKVFSDEGEKQENQFLASANALNINNIGPAAAKTLWQNLHNDIDNLINIIYLMNDDAYQLIYDKLGNSRSVNNIVNSLKQYKENITLEDIILSFCFKSCGNRASALCAKIISGQNYTVSSMSAVAYKWAEDPNNPQYKMVMDAVDMLGLDISDIEEETVSDDVIPIIMTGSPKEFGYATKKDFLNAHPEYVETTDWKACKILMTDDLNSTSGKMKKAQKNGIQIKLYESYSFDKAIQKYKFL